MQAQLCSWNLRHFHKQTNCQNGSWNGEVMRSRPVLCEPISALQNLQTYCRETFFCIISGGNWGCLFGHGKCSKVFHHSCPLSFHNMVCFPFATLDPFWFWYRLTLVPPPHPRRRMRFSSIRRISPIFKVRTKFLMMMMPRAFRITGKQDCCLVSV